MPLHQQRVRGQEGSAAAAAAGGFMGDTAAQAQQQVRWDPVLGIRELFGADPDPRNRTSD
jgi:hypothetical protein